MSRPITEKAFQGQVLEQADCLGWRHYHTFESRRSPAGFPDLVLVRRGRLIFAELKAEAGKLTAAQIDWYADLLAVQDAAPGVVDVRAWRPSEWESIDDTLARRE